jgi:hypothetical protein
MIKVNPKEKENQTMEAKLTFLKIFPVCEIDHPDIQLICKSYKKDNSSLISCLTLLRKYDEYFYNWYKNNKMCNVFYGKRN